MHPDLSVHGVSARRTDTHASLSNQFASQNAEMGAYVDQVNNLASSIGEMNHEIVIAQQAGLPANELQDQRDSKVMQLSEMVGAGSPA